MDYRGEVGIVIQNSSNYMMRIDLGTYLAQGVLYHSIQDQFIWVDELSNTERGEGGFGSSGRNAEHPVTEDQATKHVQSEQSCVITPLIIPIEALDDHLLI